MIALKLVVLFLFAIVMAYFTVKMIHDNIKRDKMMKAKQQELLKYWNDQINRLFSFRTERQIALDESALEESRACRD